MKFQVGDTIMHWSHGLGLITGMEERKMMGESQLYYVVKVQDLNIWVPADKLAAGRMRLPTSARSFKKLLAVLNGPSKVLPDDRRERKLELHTKMSDGTAESICDVIRDLTRREEVRTLNDDDRSTLQRAKTMLLGEWGYALKVPPMQAETDLQDALKHSSGRREGSNGKKRSQPQVGASVPHLR